MIKYCDMCEEPLIKKGDVIVCLVGEFDPTSNPVGFGVGNFSECLKIMHLECYYGGSLSHETIIDGD